MLLPVDETPYRMDWVALLVVARRHQWPGRDAWLAEHVASTEAISIREPEAADVGASVAAVLVHAAGGSDRNSPCGDMSFRNLIDLENPGFGFTRPDGRAAVENGGENAPGAKPPKPGRNSTILAIQQVPNAVAGARFETANSMCIRTN